MQFFLQSFELNENEESIEINNEVMEEEAPRAKKSKRKISAPKKNNDPRQNESKAKKPKRPYRYR